MDTKSLYQEYIKSKVNRWSDATVRSESKRIPDVCFVKWQDGPSQVWDSLNSLGLSLHSKSRIVIRLAAFTDWLIRNNHIVGPNKYTEFKRENKSMFRNMYDRKIPEISFDEAVRRLDQLPQRSREKAKQIIRNGLRWTESNTLRDGRVTGKGRKPRRVFNDRTAVRYPFSYATFRRDLKTVGLKPHDLRKIAAGHLFRNGARIDEVMEFAGWSSMTTALFYLKATSSEVEAKAACLKI